MTVLATTQLNSLKQAFTAALWRTERIFDCIAPEAYTAQPIPLRHPFVFYEGHLPAFIWNAFFRRVLDTPSFNPDFDRLFERGIDPEDANAAQRHAVSQWPERRAVRHYKQEVHKRLFDFLETDAQRPPTHPLLRNHEILYLLLEHELMHQETLVYILHQLPEHLKLPFAATQLPMAKTPLQPAMAEISAGATLLGARPGEFDFTWDNERAPLWAEVPAFRMDVLPVTNGQFLEFVEAGGYGRPEFWTVEDRAWLEKSEQTHPFFWTKTPEGWMQRDCFRSGPLPPDHPVCVTQAEAAAYARFAGKSLPTEAEWHRAAYDEDRPYPWGTEAPTEAHGNFDFRHWSTTPVGAFPQGASPSGILDMLGNTWEWTETPFAPFPGFEASPGYPQYSADFFDGKHFVMKGGCHLTDTRLLRRSFRNWFYGHYPYMVAGFRCVER